ncbi:MAG: LysR family transcriptional regulator [Bryobacteraceae bacterium]
MDVKQLRYFLAVARAGSFVKAAEAEGVAQPSLSQMIKKLELELDAPLFDRLGRTVRLTAHGEALLPHAEAVLRSVEQGRRAVEAARSPARGAIAVGVIPTLLPGAFAPALDEFQQKFPEIRIHLTDRTTENLLEKLKLGELDIALLVLPIRHPEIVCSELFREPLLAALPPGHPLACNGPVPLNRLQGERLLLLREGHCLRENVLEACTRARADFESYFESDQLESLLALVEAGFGVSLAPATAARRNSGCRFLPIHPPAVRRVGYALAGGHHLLPVHRTFTQFLRKYDWQRLFLAPPENG